LKGVTCPPQKKTLVIRAAVGNYLISLTQISRIYSCFIKHSGYSAHPELFGYS